MNTKFLKTAFIGLVLSVSSFANAGLVINGDIYNFDADTDGNADDLLISQITFDVTAGTQLLIDSLVWESTGVDLNGDGELTGFDNYMRLYSGATSLTSNDDAPLGNDGSVHSYDSQIAYFFDTAGSFMVTVGQLSYTAEEGLQGYDANRAYSDYNGIDEIKHGDWQLTFSTTSGSVSNIQHANDIPEPSTLAIFALGIMGLVSRKFKK